MIQQKLAFKIFIFKGYSEISRGNQVLINVATEYCVEKVIRRGLRFYVYYYWQCSDITLQKKVFYEKGGVSNCIEKVFIVNKAED